MNMPRFFTKALSVCVVLVLLIPPALLSSPRVAHAVIFFPVEESGTALFKTIFTSIQEGLQTALQTTGTAAQVAQQVNTYVLQPLAFVLSGNLMKTLTAGVISFVIGKANGTGVPQFVTDVQKSMQTVGDSQALAFLNQMGRNSNSPFASAIGSSLRNNYLSKTSLEGFWRANMNTLWRTSPNVNGFLAGRWSQGGAAAWFALTTQVQNNPYTLYQSSQGTLASRVGPGAGGATGARASDIAAGGGFMSWCGEQDTSANSTYAAIYNAAQTANAAYGAAVDSNASAQTIADAKAVADSANANLTAFINANPGATKSGSAGVNPGDPCTDSDGNPGTIKTPGSTIKATLDKVLGGNQDQIVRMGNVGPQINQILGNIATVLQTVQFASQILGGPGSGGLFGVNAPSSSNSNSRLIQYQNTPGNMGVTSIGISAGAGNTPGADIAMSSRITQYTTSWNTISAAANTASASVTTLVSTCAAQSAAAQAAIFNYIAPVQVQATTASATAATATNFVRRVQGEIGTPQYTADSQALSTMSPTTQDVANAQQDAATLGGATANPVGSLIVSGGSVVDRMNLLNTNAIALKAACTP